MTNIVQNIGKSISDFGSRFGQPRSAFDINQYAYQSRLNWEQNKASWVALRNPQDFEIAARENPIVKATVELIASAASNGIKIARDTITGEIIPWTDKRPVIQNAYKLFAKEPYPTQTPKEFQKQGTFYRKIFGNRYVYGSMGSGLDEKELDILWVNTLMNVPSQYVEIKTTGKLYDQIRSEDIIEYYADTNQNPIKKLSPKHIIHFNEVNFSSEMPMIMGISPLEALKMPITNTQYAFEAMNSILKSRGFSGIVSPNKTSADGGHMIITPEEQNEIDKKFKAEYGTRSDQNMFWFSPIPVEYIKTVMNSKEMGIYEEFSNNAIIICNGFGVAPDLVKTYIQGITYENQDQSWKSLYDTAVIPMVRDEDEQWSNKLNTFKYGFRIDTSWDHIPVLQKSFKDKAVANNNNSKAANTAWSDNQITRDMYLGMISQPSTKDGTSDMKKFEYDKHIGITNDKENTNTDD